MRLRHRWSKSWLGLAERLLLRAAGRCRGGALAHGLLRQKKDRSRWASVCPAIVDRELLAFCEPLIDRRLLGNQAAHSGGRFAGENASRPATWNASQPGMGEIR
jgi:hypothetical protein